ncbi:MAG: tRNA glutamyl-Q(34) synthetase GluQRS [Solirubrobacteraceae bacterium]|nr:tRNA glutamyl-Q(34) synthetase GluQRS [Solirubrobacteraceae bacterium]MDP4672920.1 tRNA glutamyl-Q(34) synthetase GluQRS [Solirubrobacteraceae bacterium]MDP4920556.1 tRNA glutamyl-Q(34) synthetase GluQRS [Solirubrobacteraceae bacterium]
MAEGLIQLAPALARSNGRFAPSPTGPLHLGNLRTALIAWCCARSTGSGFAIRIEDLDRARCRAGSAEQQLNDLTALGLEWDRPVVVQSERTALYADALGQLRSNGLLYECWCTRAEIREASSAPHGAANRYPGSCRDLSAAQLAKRRASGRKPALRVRAEGARLQFFDRAGGEQEGAVDDFVVARQDGAFAYHLAVVVDDADQSIDEVVRGDDLLDSTGAQCWLQDQLGLTRPSYVHVPLLRDESGTRMSKRDSSVTLGGQQQLSVSADQVRSKLIASIGLCDEGEQIDDQELLSRFNSILVESIP